MDKLKKFLKDKKVNNHFKHSGQGAKLSDGPPSRPAPSVSAGTMQGASADRVHASDVAAQAALKRLYANEPTVSSSQKKIQMMAMRELEKERRERESAGAKFSDDMKNLVVVEPKVHELEHSNAITSVKYTCELLGDEIALPKEQLRERLEEFLYGEMREDPIIASSLLITSLNRSVQKKSAMETIRKYIQNIMEHEGEEKYRKIRMGNKAFQDRILGVKGGIEFLTAIGFEKVEEKATADSAPEPFLVMGEEAANDTGRLLQAMELLEDSSSTGVPLRVARDTKVFTLREGESVPVPGLPSDFFTLTGDELKREQEKLSVTVDRLTTMRTREMREKDGKVAEYRYKYTLVRVRTPDKILIQGVFGVHEPFSSVREWVRSLLAEELAEFDLLLSTSVINDDSASLAELGLAPAVTVHLICKGGSVERVLSEEALQDALPFTIQ